MARPAGSQSRLTGLDALRGVAALCVLAHHVGILAGGGFASRAYLAVDFFFALSGYVMARSFEPMENPRAFLAARLRRLWPLVAFGMLLGIPAYLMANGAANLPAALCLGLLLIPAFSIGALYPLNPAAWSIAFELMANAIHAWSLAKIRTAHLMALVAVLFMVSAGISYSAGAFDLGHEPSTFLAGIPRCLFSYVMGICLFRVWRDSPPFTLPAPVVWVAMPGLLLIDFPTGLAFDLMFVAVVTPVLLAGGIAHEARLGTALGRLSFPLYATHLPVLMALAPVTLPGATVAALTVALCVSACPSLSLIRKRFGQRASPGSAL